MELKTETFERGTILTPNGNLDSTTSSSFNDVMMKVIEEGAANIIVDMAQLKYISSSGLRVLLAGLKKIKTKSGLVILAGLQPHVKEVLDIAGFTPLFTITATKEEAIARCKPA